MLLVLALNFIEVKMFKKLCFGMDMCSGTRCLRFGLIIPPSLYFVCVQQRFWLNCVLTCRYILTFTVHPCDKQTSREEGIWEIISLIS